jgi:hypothetical protein
VFFSKKTHDIVKRVNLDRRSPRQLPIFLEIETIADINTSKLLLYSTGILYLKIEANTDNTRPSHPLIFY